jgi:hypothetical protein
MFLNKFIDFLQELSFFVFSQMFGPDIDVEDPIRKYKFFVEEWFSK